MPSKFSDKKNFTVVKSLPAKKAGLKRTTMVFSNRQARGAALKAANRKIKKIYLHEAGTKKIHVFAGSTKLVKTKHSAPEWVERPKHREAAVKKVRIHYLE
jgi:hypothetical protein